MKPSRQSINKGSLCLPSKQQEKTCKWSLSGWQPCKNFFPPLFLFRIFLMLVMQRSALYTEGCQQQGLILETRNFENRNMSGMKSGIFLEFQRFCGISGIFSQFPNIYYSIKRWYCYYCYFILAPSNFFFGSKQRKMHGEEDFNFNFTSLLAVTHPRVFHSV